MLESKNISWKDECARAQFVINGSLYCNLSGCRTDALRIHTIIIWLSSLPPNLDVFDDI